MVRRPAALLLVFATPLLAQSPIPTASAATPPAPKEAVAGGFVLPAKPLWVGEVFDLKLAWRVDWDLFRALSGDPEWKPDPLVAESWTRDPLGKPVPERGKSIATLTLSTRAMALKPGQIALKPLHQEMQLVTGGYETDGVKIVTIGQASAASAGATLIVRPLPPAPAGFTGAVGAFTLASSLDHQGYAVGKPVTWTLTLTGTGNWAGLSGLPARSLSRDFDLVGQPSQIEQKGGSLFQRTIAERITIVPRKAGHYTLGPVEMSVFDPVAGAYRTITAPEIALDVARGPAGNQPPAYEAEPDPTPVGELLPQRLSGTGDAWAPLPLPLWRGAFAFPILALALLWLVLAWERARATDPERTARRAHARLARTLAALAAEPHDAQRRALVRAWQRDAGARLGIDHAAPSGNAFGEIVWAELWDEAEHHLYGRAVPLPADWRQRAEAALAARGAPPRFDPLTVLASRNLYPVAALFVAFLLVNPAPLPAAPQADVRGRIVSGPRDWIARYDFALDRAGAKRWTLAAAHAGIAWVQQPRSAETTILWTRAAREAGFGGRAAGGLPLPGEGRGAFTGLLSPAEWQAATLALLFAAVGAGATLLIRRFGHLPRRVTKPAASVAILGLIGAFVGLVGVDGYGPAAAADAAIVWRQVPLRELPVDTPDDEAPVVLAPGTVGHLGRVFMGWQRLTLADGRSGWLRRDELLPLWRDQYQ